MASANPFKAFAPYWEGYGKRVGLGISWLLCTQAIALSIPMLLKWAVDTIEAGLRGADAAFITGDVEGDVALFAVLVAGLALISVMMIAGIRFQSTSSGDDEGGPLGAAITGSLATGAGIWYLLRKQLRSYMTFEQHPNMRIDKDRFYTVGDLVRGQARIPLSNARLRVVGYNMEKGQYQRGSGTQTRTVSFSNPVNGVMLYDETVDHIPARTQIANSFPGHLAFDDMFRQLYPPQLVGSKHGLATHWEVQVILDDLLDQEVIGDIGSLRYEDFLAG